MIRRVSLFTLGLALILTVACGVLAEPTTTVAPSAASQMWQSAPTAAPTAVPAAYPDPATTMPILTSAPYPSLNIQTPSPYPGPLPRQFPPRTRPTPTPTTAVYSLDDCTLHPSFNRCGGAPLTGNLAYFSTNGQLIVLNLDSETAWFSTQTNLNDVDWSPVGDRLLVHDESLLDTYFYHQDGRLLHSETSGWVRWKGDGNEIRAGSYLWNEDYSAAVSIVVVEVQDATGDNTHAEQQLQVDFQDGTGRKIWPLGRTDFRNGAVVVLDWVPQTEWVLVGYTNGGEAARIISGYALTAVNVRSGEIVESSLFVPGVEQIDWHPSEPRLLVTTDLRYSEIGGIGKLVVWQVQENQVTYLSESPLFTRSPVWSPDGRFIAYTAYDPSTEKSQLQILDTETNTGTTRAENGEFPAWSQDGNTLFFLELGANNENALIKAVGRDQGIPLLVAESRFPRCPGTCLPRTAFDYAP